MELIKVTKENGVNLVSARELHEFLGVKSKFADWIKNRIKKYGFEENVDFTRVCEVSKSLEGSRLVERENDNYILKIDMAKELSMVENNDRGREARKYFIECERQLVQIKQDSYMIENPIERAKAWIVEEEERQSLRLEVKKQEGIIEAQKEQIKDAVSQIYRVCEKAHSTTFDIAAVSKLLGYKGLGEKKFFSLMRDKKWLNRNNSPAQIQLDRGRMVCVMKYKYDGEPYNQTRITVKGIFWLGYHISKLGYSTNVTEDDLINQVKNLVK